MQRPHSSSCDLAPTMMMLCGRHCHPSFLPDPCFTTSKNLAKLIACYVKYTATGLFSAAMGYTLTRATGSYSVHVRKNMLYRNRSWACVFLGSSMNGSFLFRQKSHEPISINTHVYPFPHLLELYRLLVDIACTSV